jgi:hypothetical protein
MPHVLLPQLPSDAVSYAVKHAACEVQPVRVVRQYTLGRRRLRQ